MPFFRRRLEALRDIKLFPAAADEVLRNLEAIGRASLEVSVLSFLA